MTLWHLVSNCMETARIFEFLAAEARTVQLASLAVKCDKSARDAAAQAELFQRAVMNLPDVPFEQLPLGGGVTFPDRSKKQK